MAPVAPPGGSYEKLPEPPQSGGGGGGNGGPRGGDSARVVKKESNTGTTHPTLVARLKPHCLRFGKVMLGKLLRWVGKTAKDMPSLSIHSNIKEKSVCWGHVLGGCSWGKCRFTHEYPALTDEDVEKIWAVVGPAVAVALQQPTAPKKEGGR